MVALITPNCIAAAVATLLYSIGNKISLVALIFESILRNKSIPAPAIFWRGQTHRTGSKDKLSFHEEKANEERLLPHRRCKNCSIDHDKAR